MKRKIALLLVIFFMKANLSFSQNRVDDLMKKMTLDEKIGQLNLLSPGGTITGTMQNTKVGKKIKNGEVGAIFGLKGVEIIKKYQRYAVDSTRLSIPLLVGLDVIHGHRTIFPIPLGSSCSWDMDLIKQSAQIAAKEATADGIMWTFSPMVDIARDPRWGRIAEGGGEDPFLGSAISRAMVEGYQGNKLDDSKTVAACVKHFAAYGAPEGGRDYATVDMSKVRLFNEYLPPYKAAVDAGVATIMTSFNVIDYVPASGNKELYIDILRKKWAFEGMVVTDYTAINEMIAHGLGDLKKVSQLSLKSGIDMDMIGEGFVKTIKESIENGALNESDVDRACRRILKLKEDLGLFDDPYRYLDETRQNEIMSQENRLFARKMASESFVLLKNEKQTLPISDSKKVALIGPLADSRRNMLGTWSVSGDHSKAVTVKEAFEAWLPKENLKYAKGANISDDPIFAKKVNAFGKEIVIDERSAEELINEAIEVANQSDVIVAVMGEAADMSGEASSLAHIGLQPSQTRLLNELKKLNKPIVMVLYNGRPMTLNWENENMDAILDVWFGGTEGANAIVDVISGKVNPSGKLTTSFPVHVGQVPVYHSMLNSGRPELGKYQKFKSNYLDIPNTPLFPFGYGLSYTTFEISKPVYSNTNLNAGNSISVSVDVKNTGNIAGAEVVQLYIRDLVGSISRPLKELKGFEKVFLEAGESKTVTFKIDEELLKFYNSKLNYQAEKGQFEIFIGNSSNNVTTQIIELK